jgi:hypothetical protein
MCFLDLNINFVIKRIILGIKFLKWNYFTTLSKLASKKEWWDAFLKFKQSKLA